MTRFFRKHSRILLLVFMAVLMVVFVIGDAIGRGGWGAADPFEEEIGRAWGEPVTTRDLQRADVDFRVARGLNTIPVGMQTLEFLGRSGADSSLAVHLLASEAERAGIRVDESQILPHLQQAGIPDAEFDTIRQQFGLSRDGIFRSLARMVAIGVLADTQASAAMLTPRHETAAQYRQFMQSAKLKASVLDARAFLHLVPEPSEEELQAHFAAARERDTGHTAEQLVFGYRHPDRVQIEYVTIDPADIKDLVMVREAQARRFYEDHRAEFMKTAEGPLAEGESAQLPQSYDEVRDEVRDRVRAVEAIPEAQRVINAIEAEARREWTGATPPAADQVAGFEELARKHSDTYQVEHHRTDWLDRGALMSIPTLAQGTTNIDGKAVSAIDLAFHVEGLAPQPLLADVPQLKVNEPSPVMIIQRAAAGGRSGPYQAVVFRVVAAEPSRPAESLDEVRDQVVQDVKLQKAWELAREHAERLAARAREVGLATAVDESEELRQILTQGQAGALADSQPADANAKPAADYIAKLTPVEPPRFGRTGAPIHGIRSEELVKQVFDAPAEGEQPSEPATSQPSDARVVVVPAARNQSWIIAEASGLEPLYQDQFDQFRPMIEQQAQMQTRQLFHVEWCRPDNVRQRANYAPARPEETQEQEPVAAAAAK